MPYLHSLCSRDQHTSPEAQTKHQEDLYCQRKVEIKQNLLVKENHMHYLNEL